MFPTTCKGLFLLFGLQLAVHVNGMCPNACSGRGRCSVFNTCECHHTFHGPDCSFVECPVGIAWHMPAIEDDKAHELVECSNRGKCDKPTGECKCESGFTGKSCDRLSCECNGNGICISLRESAKRNFEITETFTYEDKWDADKIQGCLCNKGFSGPDCSLRDCPVGDDPLTTGQTNEIQIVRCLGYYPQQRLVIQADNPLTSGTFILAYGKASTTPMDFNVTNNGTDTSLQTKLNDLSEVRDIVISRQGDNTEDTNRYSWGITVPDSTSQYVVRPKWRRREVQKLGCAVAAGTIEGTGFGITWGTGSTEHFEIDVSSYEQDVANVLEKFDFIRNVTVEFIYLGEDPTSENITVCTEGGTLTLVTFDEVYTLGPNPEAPGDLENIVINRPITLRPMPAAASIWERFKEEEKGLDSCRIPESQSGYCVAQGGRLSISLEDANGQSQTVADIPYDATAATLKSLLETGLSDVREVEVSYGNDKTTVCSSENTDIHYFTITFLWMVSSDEDGDIEEMQLDRTNGGSNGLACDTCQLRYSSTFTEEQQGRQCVPLSDTYTANPMNQIHTTASDLGSFEMTFRGFTTLAIDSNAPPEIVKERLEKLQSVSAVDIEYSGTHACENPANEIVVTFTQDFGDLPPIMVVGDNGLSIATANAGESFSSFKESKNGTKENLFCSGRGVCDTKSGNCACYVQFGNSNGNGLLGDTDFSRADCGVPIETIIECPGELPCSGHGVCSSYPSYACTCQEGWYGADCAERTCAKGPKWFGFPEEDNVMHTIFDLEECSSMGICDRSTGQCGCVLPFTGGACEHLPCPGAIPCSGNGRCLSTEQMAETANYRGKLLHTQYGILPNDPNTWDAHRIHGCVCDEGWFGFDCSERQCPHGDDPLTIGQKKEIQVLQCKADAGYFSLNFRHESTPQIRSNATVGEVAAFLSNLGTLGEVNVNASSTAMIAIDSGVEEEMALTTSSFCAPHYDSDGVETGGALTSFTFEDALGALPSIDWDNSLLIDTTVSLGELVEGSGVIASFSEGESGSVTIQLDSGEAAFTLESISGERESAACSDRGICDHSSGTCACFAQYASSDGKGGVDGIGARGSAGDCGAITKHVPGSGASSEA